jgi:hypothetical protein
MAMFSAPKPGALTGGQPEPEGLLTGMGGFEGLLTGLRNALDTTDNPIRAQHFANAFSVGADDKAPFANMPQAVEAKQAMLLRQQAAQQMEQERAQALEQQEQVKAWLQTNFPQYAGLPPEQGWQLAQAELQRQNAAQGGANLPSNVQEWQYYDQLSPEDQTRYLTMKRSNSPLNIGTGFVTQDPANPGSIIGPEIAIDNFGAAQDTSMGKAVGEAAAAAIIELPQKLATANSMVDTIDGILNDPALDVSTGWLSWMQAVPNTEQYRFGQRALQLQGQAFLQAFETLKGGGQITEVEGAKATQAIGRLSTAQHPADYRAALTELKGIIGTARQRAVSAAGGVQLPGNAAIQTPQQGGGFTILSVE